MLCVLWLLGVPAQLTSVRDRVIFSLTFVLADISYVDGADGEQLLDSIRS